MQRGRPSLWSQIEYNKFKINKREAGSATQSQNRWWGLKNRLIPFNFPASCLSRWLLISSGWKCSMIWVPVSAARLPRQQAALKRMLTFIKSHLTRARTTETTPPISHWPPLDQATTWPTWPTPGQQWQQQKPAMPRRYTRYRLPPMSRIPLSWLRGLRSGGVSLLKGGVALLHIVSHIFLPSNENFLANTKPGKRYF